MLISRSKFGVCVNHPSKQQMVKKRGKYLYCLECCNAQDFNKGLRNFEKKQQATRINTDEDSESRESLIADLDYYFSQYIRLLDYDKKLAKCTCYTCGKKVAFADAQCGHYEKRGNTLLRWDKRNARVQCKECNELHSGNYEEYTKRLEQEQPGITSELKSLSAQPHKWYTHELKELFIDIKAKVATSTIAKL